MRNITYLFLLVLLVGCGGRDSVKGGRDSVKGGRDSVKGGHDSANQARLEEIAGKQLEAIQSPDSVVVKRISTTVSGEQSLSDFQPLTGKELFELQNILLSVDSYDWKISKECMRLPGILVQFSKGSNQSEVRICFECNMLGFSPGKWEDFDPAEHQLISWAQSVFPDDENIQSLKLDQTKLPEPKLDFEATAKSQHSRFLTGFGWTGSPFSSPIFVSTENTRDARGVARVDGLRVGLGEEDVNLIMSKLPNIDKLPGGVAVLVEAKIHLESAVGTVSSNPPSQKKYYKVVIDELIDTRWYIPKK